VKIEGVPAKITRFIASGKTYFNRLVLENQAKKGLWQKL